MNVAQYVVVGVAAAVIAYCVHLFRERARAIREHEAMAEAMIEAELRMLEQQAAGVVDPFVPGTELADYGIGDIEPDAVGTPRPADELLPPQPEDPEATKLSAPDMKLCEQVVVRMRAAGMVDEIDGFVELHGNAKAAVAVKLRGGKRALVVPYYETDVFADRNLRRYDRLVFIGRSGKAVVVSTLENEMADRLGGDLK